MNLFIFLQRKNSERTFTLGNRHEPFQFHCAIFSCHLHISSFSVEDECISLHAWQNEDKEKVKTLDHL